MKIIKLKIEEFRKMMKKMNEYRKCCKALNEQIRLYNEFKKKVK